MTGHVVLVGLSGTGKTSVGRRIAALLSVPFVDADEEIESRTGRTVRGIFAQDGEAAFREVEATVIADLVGATDPSVIAAGGGAVVTEATRKLLTQPHVFVIWLTATPEFLASRTSKKAHRPLLDSDPVATLRRLSDERTEWYAEVADVEFDVRPDHAAAPKPEAKDNIARALEALVRDHEAHRGRDHIVLVGPMGSGKSTVGRLIAKALQRPLQDSDEQFERTLGLSAREIADAQGLSTLHRLERDALRSALASTTPSVITAAASTADEAGGRIALTSAKHVVFLRVDPEVSERREAGGAHRPDIAPGTSARRVPLYESVATAIVDVDGLDPNAVAERVLAAVGVPA